MRCGSITSKKYYRLPACVQCSLVMMPFCHPIYRDIIISISFLIKCCHRILSDKNLSATMGKDSLLLCCCCSDGMRLLAYRCNCLLASSPALFCRPSGFFFSRVGVRCPHEDYTGYAIASIYRVHSSGSLPGVSGMRGWPWSYTGGGTTKVI